MVAFVYILFSKRLDKFYTGLTTVTVNERLGNHLSKIYGELNFTQKANDRKLFYSVDPSDHSPLVHKVELE